MILIASAAMTGLWLLVNPVRGDTPPARPSPGGAASAPQAVPSFRRADHIAVLTIHGEIDSITRLSLERRAAAAVRDGADTIVFDIDTPGGDLLPTLDICNLIKDRSATPANTVAWINPTAYSAGTIIALSCREIVTAPNARMGDAAPIQGIPGLGFIPMPADERAKVESPVLAEVTDSARRNHYDEKLLQSFISVGIELWLIENDATGDRAFVDRDEYKRLFGEDPPTQITSITPHTASGQPAPRVMPRFSTAIPRADAKPLDPAAQKREIEMAQALPPARPVLTEADRGNWRLVTQVDSADRLLTLNQDEAIHYGLATQIIRNDGELKAYFGAQSLVRYDQSWSESLVRFLVSWPVRALLIIIFLISLFVEMSAPGVGVFGAAAVVALLILIGAPALVGMAQWWEILLILVGLLLVLAEIFIIPGFGITGVAGAVCLLVGIVGTFVSGDLTSEQGQHELLTGIGTTVTALMLAGVGVWLISRHLHSFPLIDRLILHAEVGDQNSAGAGLAGAGLLESMGRPQRALAAGDRGVSETDLRPSGRASFNGRLVDVQTQGSYIPKGMPIRVVSVGRFAIEVEEAEA